ncbi:MAG: biotin/lipoyl-containing protein [Planctomycetaceae bacterium]
MNGQPREVVVVDTALQAQSGPSRRKADPANPLHVGASMPGMVVKVHAAAGEAVTKGQKLITLEAMKMQTMLTAEQVGKVVEVLVDTGVSVETGDLLMVLKE